LRVGLVTEVGAGIEESSRELVLDPERMPEEGIGVQVGECRL
jgi:hypothetical protein